jgi:hypothetical protein
VTVAMAINVLEWRTDAPEPRHVALECATQRINGALTGSVLFEPTDDGLHAPVTGGVLP